MTRAIDKDAVERDELTKRLCDLHARLARCFSGAMGEQPPTRPRFFTPQWSDTETVLDAAVALDRTHQPTEQTDDAVVERVARAIADCEWDQVCSALGTPNHPRGGNWTAKLPQARAAIAAMMPTGQTK